MIKMITGLILYIAVVTSTLAGVASHGKKMPNDMQLSDPITISAMKRHIKKADKAFKKQPFTLSFICKTDKYDRTKCRLYDYNVVK